MNGNENYNENNHHHHHEPSILLLQTPVTAVREEPGDKRVIGWRDRRVIEATGMKEKGQYFHEENPDMAGPQEEPQKDKEQAPASSTS